MAGAEAPVKRSDLGVRAVSAVVMLSVAGTALWFGGRAWTAFVAVIALGVLWEWWRLVAKFVPSPVTRTTWMIIGFCYIALASAFLDQTRQGVQGLLEVSVILAVVIATDVGAYFTGRTIGGPKIAPAISPSKTWSGLFGGMIGASLPFLGIVMSRWDSISRLDDFPPTLWVLLCFVSGAMLAVVAQTGDFFESWMKRRAGVKDSGRLIPGHGGLFDRVDGLLAVCFALALLKILTNS